MRPAILITALLLTAATGCCKQPSDGNASPASSDGDKSDDGDDKDEGKGKLASLTSETMAAKAKKDDFKVREEATERTELPGATIYRLTLDHSSKGTAFVDLYDMSNVASHASKPAVEVGSGKTLYVSVDGGSITSAQLLKALTAKSPLESLTRAEIEAYLKGDGWTLGDSAKFKDDITGQQVTDVSADKGDADAMVVLMDYSRVASGKEQSAMARDGDRLLFVDTEKRSWSKSLLKRLMK